MGIVTLKLYNCLMKSLTPGLKKKKKKNHILYNSNNNQNYTSVIDSKSPS